MQIRRFAAVSSQSGPRFCEECREAIDRTPFGRCNRGALGDVIANDIKGQLGTLGVVNRQSLDRIQCRQRGLLRPFMGGLAQSLDYR